MELDILKLLSIKDNYYHYIKYIKEHTLTKESYIILKDMDKYYIDTSVDTIDWADFSPWFCVTQHSSWEAETLDKYKSIFKNLETIPMPADDTAVVKHFVTLDYATRIFDITGRVAEGTSTDLIPVSILMDEYAAKLKIDSFSDAIVLDDDDDYLVSMASGKHGFKWALECLNKSLGDLGLGDFVLLTGRPDAGKTTMLAQNMVHFAPQMKDGKHILWFNNEEQGAKVKMRIMQAALGKTTKEILDDYPKAKAAYQAAIGGADKIILYDSAHITPHDILNLINKYPPAVIVIDKLSKLSLHQKKGELDTKHLQNIAEFGRSLAKEYAPVICTEWADGSAQGKDYITMEQIYGTKTGVQGEADAIIAIGRKDDEPTVPDRNNRYIHIPKNKMTGNDESLRNGKFQIRIQPTIARFKE